MKLNEGLPLKAWKRDFLTEKGENRGGGLAFEKVLEAHLEVILDGQTFESPLLLMTD